MNEYIRNAQDHNEKALVALQKDFSKLRTGRANAAVLEGITVNYYGAATPITQVAAVKCPEAHMLTIEPWDKSIVNAVEKAIMASDLGVTPSNDGCGMIRLPFPAPTEERRKEIVKECKTVAEKGRVAIRNNRQDAKKKMEKAEKDGEMSEDELKRAEDELQKITDKYIAKVGELLAAKEAEIMEI
ncbi:MAG: ribosome recycling factor [Coriobacteriales bacterium]